MKWFTSLRVTSEVSAAQQQLNRYVLGFKPAVFLPLLIEASGDFKQRCHINFLFSASEGVTLRHFLAPRLRTFTQKRFAFWERKICCQSVFEQLSDEFPLPSGLRRGVEGDLRWEGEGRA